MNRDCRLDRTYILPYDVRAMLRLSLGTAWLVATILVIPDAISLTPNCSQPLVLIIRVIGLWLSAYLQWFIAFFMILNGAGLLNRGIIINQNGIKLSRFSRQIAWKEIKALSSESAPFVSRLLLLPQPAVRLNLFVEDGRGKMVSKNLDSLLFANVDFENLFNIVCWQTVELKPNSAQVVMFSKKLTEPLTRLYQGVGLKRAIFVVYVAAMLILFMGRTCARNYLYNQAGSAFNKAQYEIASDYCRKSLAIDGTFAYAWDRLARCQFRMGKTSEAEVSWKAALKFKPDLVASKVGLSRLYMQDNRQDDAVKLLLQAARLAPRDIPTLINLGAVTLRSGNTMQALTCYDRALSLAPSDPTLRTVAAEAYLEAGQSEKAAHLLGDLKLEQISPEKQSLFIKLKTISKRAREDHG